MLPHQDTIAAPATAAGMAALSVIRISGKDAFPVVDKIFRPRKKGVTLAGTASHRIVFGDIADGHELIDEVLVSIFRAPHSFTGEDTVEISCHGSPFIVKRIMELLIKLGVRTAAAGEFSLRAFLNGKMDLSQAEAVADLIATTTEAEHRLAMSQMKGGLSKIIQELRQSLIDFASLIELELDFSEEDVEFADRKQLLATVEQVLIRIDKLIRTFETGNAIRQGIPVVIAGRPNAGKSTLLNALLQDNRAIVSPLPGTTRDTIEEERIIDGIRFRFIDTAGIRSAQDQIEKMGVERTFEKMKQARMVIYLFDINEMSAAEVINEINNLKPEFNPDKTSVIICANKCDLASASRLKEFEISGCLFLSAKNETGLDQLLKRLSEPFLTGLRDAGHLIITHSRHYDALIHTREALLSVREGVGRHLSHDLIAADLRLALNYLGEIAGTISTETILDSIFSRFCIGK